MNQAAHCAKTNTQKRRVPLDYVQIPVKLFSELSFKEYFATHGHAGVVFYWRILLAIGEREGAFLPRRYAIRAGEEVGVSSDKAESYLASLVAEGLLQFDIDSESYTSNDIREDQESLAGKRERWRKANSSRLQRGNSDDAAMILNTEYLNTEDLNNNKKVVSAPEIRSTATEEPAPEDDEYTAAAKQALIAPTGAEAWELSAAYMNLGRRPLRKFPRVFLSVPELSDVMRQYDAAGIPPERLHDALHKADGRLSQGMVGGKSPERQAAYNWLIGWIKNEVIQEQVGIEKLNKGRRVYAK